MYSDNSALSSLVRVNTSTGGRSSWPEFGREGEDSVVMESDSIATVDDTRIIEYKWYKTSEDTGAETWCDSKMVLHIYTLGLPFAGRNINIQVALANTKDRSMIQVWIFLWRLAVCFRSYHISDR